MFNFSKNLFPSDKSDKDSEKMKLNQEEELKIGELDIHTMKKDLENINNPDYFNDSTVPSSKIEKVLKPKENKPVLNEKQKNSPFLSATDLEKKKVELPQREETKKELSESSGSFSSKDNPGGSSVSSKAHFLKTPEMPDNSQNKTILLNEESSQNKGHKILLVAVVLVIIILSSAGGYYFWTTRQNTGEQPQPPVEITTPTPEPEINTPTISPNLVTLSADKPNYLNLDIKNINSDQIQEELQKSAEKVQELNVPVPIEFLVADLDNNPLPFSEFSQKIGLVLTPDLLSTLDNSFSLFIYQDEGISKVGLVIETKDEAIAKKTLQKEESNLPKELQPLFLGKKLFFDQVIFKDNSYSNANIRYFNFSNPEKISIDYSLTEGKLLIGTSKNTIRALIDLQNK